MFKNGRLVPFLEPRRPFGGLGRMFFQLILIQGGVFIYLKQVWFGGGGEGEKIEGFTIHCTSCTPPGHTRISS